MSSSLNSDTNTSFFNRYRIKLNIGILLYFIPAVLIVLDRTEGPCFLCVMRGRVLLFSLIMLARAWGSKVQEHDFLSKFS